MNIGLDIVDFTSGIGARGVRQAVSDIAEAEKQGFTTAWVPLLAAGPDPLVVCQAAAAATNQIAVATGVLRTWGHHPVELARQAGSIGSLVPGRLIIGVGVSHRPIVETNYGQQFTRPAAHLREYLVILRALVATGEVDYHGEFYTAHTNLDIDNMGSVRIAAAAGGPRMIAAAAEFADIVVTNMAGPGTIATHTRPRVLAVAKRAERRPPKLAAAVTVCVTDEPTRTAEAVDALLVGYANNPDYRAMLDREGADRPSDIAIVGDEQAVTARLDALHDVGVDELIASVKTLNPTDEARTRALLGSRSSL